MSDEVIGAILPLIPSLIIAVARVLAKKLAELGGISPIEQTALDMLNVIEAFINAQTK
jgi:hypothetical protein